MSEKIGALYHEQSFDLTAIFNAHGTAQDAKETLEYITPNSIVFREGIIRQQDRIDALMELARLRLEAGYYTNDARALADDIMQKRAAATDRFSVRSRDYHAVFFPGILEKNSVLYPADCVDITGDNLFVDDTDWVWADMMRMAHERSPRNIDRMVDADTTFTEAWVRENRVREEAAIARIQEVFGKVAVGETTNLDGRAYVVYGALHRRSLTQRLAEAGVALAAVKYALPPERLERLRDLATLTDISIEERRTRVREAITRAWKSEVH